MKKAIFVFLLISAWQAAPGHCQLLDFLPKPGDAAPAVETGAMLYRYFLMSSGQAVGDKVQVEINDRKVASIQRPEDAQEVTAYLHPGLNTVRFTAADQKRSTGGAGSALALTIGPEYRREATGKLGQTRIDLRETTIHYVRPAAHRGGDSVVEMRFTVKDDPNPAKLKKKYVIYADGFFTGHLVQVAVNGVPIVDVMAPDFHCDLNPYLRAGDNEITFSSVRLEGYPFTAAERTALGEQGLEVGVAEAGEFDPANFTAPVLQIVKSGPRFIQPGGEEEPAARETYTLLAE